MHPFLILLKVAERELVINDPVWKNLKKIEREKAVCGKRTGSRKKEGFYRKLASLDIEDYPNYEKMQKSFKVARDLILLK